MEVRIGHGGGRSAMSGFYRARAMQRCGGGSVASDGERFNISVTGVEGSQEEGKHRGGSLPKGEEDEASSSRQ
jgi:hypothetical protein